MALGGEGDAAHAFLQAALSIPYKLSTSQIPQRQTNFKVCVRVSCFPPSPLFSLVRQRLLDRFRDWV